MAKPALDKIERHAGADGVQTEAVTQALDGIATGCACPWFSEPPSPGPKGRLKVLAVKAAPQGRSPWP